VNVAVTLRARFIVSRQLPSPEQSPLHEVNEPLVAVAVRTTSDPNANDAVHAPSATPAVTTQSIPAGSDFTRPVPLPAPATLNVCAGPVNVAVTERAWSIVTAHAPVPEHAPLQPAKVLPPLGLAVNVT
jgi:hypothetical protein